mgnify:CR=1 FL=1
MLQIHLKHIRNRMRTNTTIHAFNEHIKVVFESPKERLNSKTWILSIVDNFLPQNNHTYIYIYILHYVSCLHPLVSQHLFRDINKSKNHLMIAQLLAHLCGFYNVSNKLYSNTNHTSNQPDRAYIIKEKQFCWTYFIHVCDTLVTTDNILIHMALTRTYLIVQSPFQRSNSTDW